jgi:hypothetical protein
LFQHPYALREPYAGWERQYLEAFPGLQQVMDVMIGATRGQLADPAQDILHNRVCSAIAWHMAGDMALPLPDRRLIVAGDLLHNIAKEDRARVLTNAATLQSAAEMIARLRGAGRLRGSPWFWTDTGLFGNAALGANRALVHHITSAVAAAEILRQLAFSEEEILRVQDAILAHSTGCWYFRAAVDADARRAEVWRQVYPEPEGALATIVHDADLVSQFDAESVLPAGSKWRTLAAKRWGAEGGVEEAHVVHYVLERLVDEARSPRGRDLAQGEWERVRPELLTLMGLAEDARPCEVFGVPMAFR